MPRVERKVSMNEALQRTAEAMAAEGVSTNEVYLTGSRARREQEYARGPNASDVDISVPAKGLTDEQRRETQEAVQRRLEGTGVDFGFEDPEELKYKAMAGEATKLKLPEVRGGTESKG